MNTSRLRVTLFAGLASVLPLLAPTPAQAADPRATPPHKARILVHGSATHGANGMFFDRRNGLYIASFNGREILGMNPRTGKILDRLSPPEMDVGDPDDLTFGPDGSLYWTSLLTGEVHRLSPAGEKSTLAIGSGVNPITFSDDGRLFVSQCFQGQALYELDPSLSRPPRLIRDDLGP